MIARTLIKGSVGQGGANDATDVRVVQRLLNYWLVPSGLPRLTINGVAGPATLAAITSFQRATAMTPSGRIEPGAGIEALFNRHLFHLVDSIGLSVISEYVDKSKASREALADPAVGDAVRKYIDALRRLA